ncbi:PH domain-containing protein [Gordonia sp. zg691]|uniref:PH domain-containing protein n=1 Tax=Gordonia jinghuaiqii TaxID=2758710 RepID=A0A7D7R153_9ACTN|nr:PH domain-containing protein [Gordonia jinghuaiqii]MBD0860834.1 PH domain-containing protein [Gordonia jinghuaiqii]MCR5979605.1 PH domain-containing protein [Gordonia jinghuaiqii]QMT00607.1 PH domain-containing protein [Gordonia jinghuaiqii]
MDTSRDSPAAPAPHPTLRDPVNMVDPRAKTLWRIGPLILGVPALVAAIVVAATSAEARWIALAAALAAAALTVVFTTVVPLWRYRFHRWEVSEDAVYSQSGWFVRHRVIIPIARIQVVDTEAGPIEQLLKLAQLTVTTASSAGTIHITGLDAEVARATAADLTIRTQAFTDDAT